MPNEKYLIWIASARQKSIDMNNMDYVNNICKNIKDKSFDSFLILAAEEAVVEAKEAIKAKKAASIAAAKKQTMYDARDRLVASIEAKKKMPQNP